MQKHASLSGDFVWVLMYGGMPSTFIERAFVQLPMFRKMATTGFLWSHALVSHTCANEALQHMLSESSVGSVCLALQRMNFTVTLVGAPDHVSPDGCEKIGISSHPIPAKNHDYGVAYHALRLLSEERNPRRPRALLLVLHACMDIFEPDTWHAQDAFDENEEYRKLPPTVYGDDARNPAAASHTIPALVAKVRSDDANAPSSLTAGRHAAKLHTSAWQALERVDQILGSLFNLLDVPDPNQPKPLVALTGVQALALREHGTVGSGTPWAAATQSFSAIYTGNGSYVERRPVKIEAPIAVLFDLCGIAQDTRCTAPAWNPSAFVAISMQRTDFFLRIMDDHQAHPEVFFFRAIVPHQGRSFAWILWFGLQLNATLRQSIGRIDAHFPPVDVRFQVFELSADPDESTDLYGDPFWRKTPLAEKLWTIARTNIINLPEEMLRERVYSVKNMAPRVALRNNALERARSAQRRSQSSHMSVHRHPKAIETSLGKNSRGISQSTYHERLATVNTSKNMMNGEHATVPDTKELTIVPLTEAALQGLSPNSDGKSLSDSQKTQKTQQSQKGRESSQNIQAAPISLETTIPEITKCESDNESWHSGPTVLDSVSIDAFDDASDDISIITSQSAPPNAHAVRHTSRRSRRGARGGRPTSFATQKIG